MTPLALRNPVSALCVQRLSVPASQSEVVEATGGLFDQPTYSEIERGARIPTPSQAAAIEAALDRLAAQKSASR